VRGEADGEELNLAIPVQQPLVGQADETRQAHHGTDQTPRDDPAPEGIGNGEADGVDVAAQFAELAAETPVVRKGA